MKLIKHLLMSYHYHMALMYDKKFQHHCKRHSTLFNEKYGEKTA